MYETRKEAAEGCRYEASVAARFSNAAIEKAANGETSIAWKLADTARMAAKCAIQAHEALWELSGGELSDEEFDAFEAAEIAQINAKKAEKAAADAVNKLNVR